MIDTILNKFISLFYLIIYQNAFMSFKYSDIQSWEVPEKNVITIKTYSKDKSDEEISDDDKDKLDIYSFLSPNVIYIFIIE